MDKHTDIQIEERQIDADGCMIGISRQWYDEARAKLATYERTDATPEQVQEWAKAAQEGRILPEGFSYANSADGKSIYVFHPIGKMVQTGQNLHIEPSSEAARDALKGALYHE